MIPKTPLVLQDSSPEILTLMSTLRTTGQRLEELTGGQVDMLLDRDGRTLFLPGTQEQLVQGELNKQAAMLNAIPACIALLDYQGIITAVNGAWSELGSSNAVHGVGLAPGLNYMESCRTADGDNSTEAHLIAEGIRTVLSGEKKSFSLAYSYRSHSEEHWFELTVTPMRTDRSGGAAVMHLNVTERHLAADALRTSVEEFRTLAEAVPQIIWITRPDGGCVYFNQQWMDYTGLALEESLDDKWDKPFHPDDKKRTWLAWQQATKSGDNYTIESRIRKKDGEYRWWLIRGTPLRDAAGSVLQWFGTCTDIHDLKVMEEALFAEKEWAQVTLNSIGDGVICADTLGNINFLNLEAEKMSRWSSEPAKGRPMAEVFRIVDSTSREVIANPAETAIEQDRTTHLPPNAVLIGRDRSETPIEGSVAPIHDRHGELTGAVIVFRDVSAAQAMSSAMTHSAHHDFLTGLPNRMLFNDRVNQAIGRGMRHGKKVAVLFLDLDGFKHINDSLGHPLGDELLCSIAECLGNCVRQVDTVSRQGGDEFVVLLSEMGKAEDAAITARRILKAVAQTRSIANHDLTITASLGVSVFPDDGLDAETLIKNADTAMYQAKQNGRQSYQFFKPVMNVRAVERQSIEENLRRALERHEFELHYQPKVDLRTGIISGAEALIRWTHPQRGAISPAAFIPIAEECGLIVPIGNWVLREACRQTQVWVGAGLPFRTMAVNISAVEFHQDDFFEGVVAILKETGLDSRSLELELTESVLMKRVELAASILRRLRDEGVQVAIDDFGTGYSSLSYLRKFPTDTLKIDQSFIRQISEGSAETTIIAAVINLGRSLNMRIVAEGLETEEELVFLKSHQCDEAQGYYFSRPVCAQEFARLLEASPSYLLQRSNIQLLSDCISRPKSSVK
jgi:diguanylate cyclase (GGDEF)-like protein/PAS domain S-box-containing protein